MAKILNMNFGFEHEEAERLSEFMTHYDNPEGGIDCYKTINEILKIIMLEIGQFKVYSDQEIDKNKREL